MRVALTFDDGPSSWTPGILDLLAERGAKGTFFVCGHAIKAREPLLRRMTKEGHEIGNHTWNHPRLPPLGDAAIQVELTSTSHTLWAITGQEPTLWRAPHFDTDQRVNEAAEAVGLSHVYATVDPGDWASSDPEAIAAIVRTEAKDGAIIDLHDGIPPDGGTGTNTRAATVAAVELILREPWEFVTVSDL